MNLKNATNRVILVGGGSSISEGIEKGLWDILKNEENVWSLNYAFKFLPFPPKRQFWVDSLFFKNNLNEIRDLHHQKNVELHAKKNELYNSYPIKQYDTYRGVAEKYKFKDYYFVGRLGLTGTFALSVACREEFGQIFLLGFDYGSTSITDKQTHFYQDKVQELKIQSSGVSNPDVYFDKQDRIKASVLDYEEFKTYPGKIWNVSLKSNISSFERIGYDRFFSLLKGE